MYTISTLNKIAPVGLDRFNEKYEVKDGAEGISGSTAVMVRSAAMHDMEFDKELLAIARAGAGVNNIPLDRCADSGIAVFNTPGANANSVREIVIAAMIIGARNIDGGLAWTQTLGDSEDVGKAVEKGKSQFVGTELKGKTLGVVGLGAVGALVANAALALGMNVVGYDPYLSVPAALRLEPAVKFYDSLEKMLPVSDFVTLHLPSMDSTNGMFNAEMFSHFKDGAILVNYSRDMLVNEKDLLAALDSGKIRKYVTDFTTRGIIGNPKVACTPHLGASTQEAEDNCAVMAADELMDYIENGNVINSVNYPRVDMGPRGGETRVSFITKGVEDPVKLAVSLMDGKTVSAVKGGKRGDYGYALVSTPDEVAEIKASDGVIRVRVIK